MPGPAPKDPEERARRNRASTAAELPADGADVEIPPLPSSLFEPWPDHTTKKGKVIKGTRHPHPLTRRWWRALWRSPMASRFLELDVEELYMLATLRDRFHRHPTPTLAAEIRQQGARFGLAPIDRRRLDWRIAGPVSAPTQPAPAARSAPDPSAPDPRQILRAL